jgi:hypothetical protein
MTGPAFPPDVAVAGVFVVAGLGFGLAYFAVLQRSVHNYIAGSGQLLAAALTLGRFAVAALFFGFAARVGALQALAAFIGFLAARALALYAVRSIG